MNEFTKKRNRLVAEKVIKNLKNRNHDAYYAEDSKEALKIALDMIPEGSSIGWGGTVTAGQVGIIDAVKNGNYIALDRNTASTPEERNEIMNRHHSADFFITSCNAISEDGQIVNIDGSGNRVSCISFGPKTVIMLVGMNKLVRTLDDAMNRAKYVAAPINAQRFNLNAPCSHTGACADCRSELRICCQTLITSYSMQKERIKVILINEELGF